jgi:hypothetical protein
VALSWGARLDATCDCSCSECQGEYHDMEAVPLSTNYLPLKKWLWLLGGAGRVAVWGSSGRDGLEGLGVLGCRCGVSW